MELPPALGAIVLDLGDVSVQERQDAYAAADLFVHPSVHESFSIVLMEAHGCKAHPRWFTPIARSHARRPRPAAAGCRSTILVSSPPRST